MDALLNLDDALSAIEAKRPQLSQAEFLELIYKDFAQREGAGAAPPRHAYYQRFPELREQLERYFEVHAVLARGALDDLKDSDFAMLSKTSATSHIADHSEPSAQGEMILGDFRIVRELARGGMGVVYEAEQLTLGRKVAVKALHRLANIDDQRHQRFLNEARAAATLHCEGVVPVISVGEEGGTCYYAMPFIEGPNLADVIADLRKIGETGTNQVDSNHSAQPEEARSNTEKFDSTDARGARIRQVTSQAALDNPAAPEFYRAAARLLAKVGRALDQAHRVGIVHRDIKPSNILLDGDGRPWISDFGLAHLESSETLTRTGDVLGTLYYMSPEQAAGESAHVDRRSDVYSLGATLYELLTCEPLFAEHKPPRLLQAVLTDEPVPLRQLNRCIPFALETIVLTALAKDPADRYDTALDLADDLRRFTRGEPVHARRAGLVDWAWRWLRRHRRAAALMSMVLLLVAFAAIGGLQYHVSQLTRLNQTLQDRQEQISDLLYVADMRSAFDALSRNDTAEVVRLVHRYDEKQVTDIARGLEWNLLKRISSRFVPQLVLRGHAGSVNDLTLIPGKPWIVSVGDDATIRIWDIDDGMQVGELTGATGELTAVGVSSDGRWLATGSDFVGLWDLDDRRFLRQITSHPEGRHVEAISFSPDGTWLASGWRYESVHLNSLRDSRMEILESEARLENLLFSSDGTSLIASARDPPTYRGPEFIRIWDIAAHPVRIVHEKRIPMVSLRFIVQPANNRSWMAVGGNLNPNIHFFDTSTHEHLGSVVLRGEWELTSLALSHDGHYCAAGFQNGTVWCCALRPGHPSRWLAPGSELNFTAHDGRLQCLRFTADGRLVTCGADGLVKVWRNPRRIPQLIGPKNAAWVSMSVSDETSQISLLARGESVVRIGMIDSEAWKESAPLPGVKRVRYSPRGRYLVVAGLGEVFVLDASTLKTHAAIRQGTDIISAIGFSRDGKLIATGSVDGTIVVRDFPALSPVYSLTVNGSCNIARFSRNGDLLLVAGDATKGIIVFDAVTRDPIRHLEYPSTTLCALWQPKTDSFVSGHNDGSIVAWDMESGAPRQLLNHHSGPTIGLAFSPDGRTLISGSWDSTVRLWHVKTGESLGILYSAADQGNTTGSLRADGWITDVRVLAGGKYIVASRDKQEGKNLLVWPCD